MRHYVYVWASGVVEHGPSVPEGAIGIAKVFSQRQLDALLVKCRLSYHRREDGSPIYLVPGVPEAPDQSAGLRALMEWLKWAVTGRTKRIIFHDDRVSNTLH